MGFIDILQTLSFGYAEFFAKVTEMSAKICVVQTLKKVITKFLVCRNFSISL
jgi:hypothetical protein